jgi:hypothetical protein
MPLKAADGAAQDPNHCPKEHVMAGRGANGRSTIVKQKDGRWHGFVSMGAKGDGTRDGVTSRQRRVLQPWRR